jgi:chaperone required for assembly of F1-ATPase
VKRFYKTVTIEPANAGYSVCLDKRAIKTPGKATLVLPAPALADAVAEEWRVQKDTIEPASMLLTRLANTAIDGTAPRRNEIIEELLKYGGGDLLCYRAEDPVLAERQRLAWDPVLDWLAERHGARLAVTLGIRHIGQPPEAILALSRALAPLDAFQLTGLHNATTLTGSLVLALAVKDARLGAPEAFDAAHLDERHQSERWGRDLEAEARLDLRRHELEITGKFMSLARR